MYPIPAHYSFIDPDRMKVELAWWLTYSKWFTHNLGHLSAAGQGKFAGQRPMSYHCATQLRQ